MAMERIFATFKDGRTRSVYDPTDPESYEAFIQALIEETQEYERSTLAPSRQENQEYYYGYLPRLSQSGNNPDNVRIFNADATYADITNDNRETINKSSYVSTDVRDAILLMLPALIRLFAASENVVYLVPRTEADVDLAEQHTAYINYVFWQDNPGFLILYGAFKDALTVRTGFVKWWTDDTKERRRKTFVNLSQAQIAMLQQQAPDAKLVSLGDHDAATDTFDETVFEYEVSKPLIRIEGVPPEEMRLDPFARSFGTSRVVGHQRVASVDELTAMGYPREQCVDYMQAQDSHDFTSENQLRNPGRYTGSRIGDGVIYGEWYIKADKDGDGIAELRYICTMGENHDIVADEPANRIKFAHFACDPISHTIVGDGISDYTKDIQRYKTGMMRGVLDSLVESINPKTVINELSTNLEDALNDDLGAVIRTRGDPSNAVSFATTPFVGQQALPIIDLMNDMLARRTGLTDAAKGLDPKALQSSTQIGVEAIINGAQERVELVARVLAETGFKDLFTGLYNEISEAPNQRRTVKLTGKWTNVDTGTFDASMGVEVNSTLGKGSDTVRMATLQNIKDTQQLIMTQFGVTNPVCGIQEFLNTITDMLSIANIKNVGRFFKTPDPQTMAAIQQAPKEPDPMALAARAQYEKVKADAAKAVGEQQFKQSKQAQDDAFRHEQLRQKTIFDQQKIEIERAKAGTPEPEQSPIAPINVASIHATNVDAAMRAHEAQIESQTAQQKIAADLLKAQMQAEAAAIATKSKEAGQ